MSSAPLMLDNRIHAQLKNSISADYYQSFSEYFSSLVQNRLWEKVTKKKISVIITIGLLFIFLYSLGFFLAFMLGETEFNMFRVSFFFLEGLVIFIALILTNLFLKHFLNLLRNFLIDQVKTTKDVNDLSLLLSLMFKKSHAIWMGIIYTLFVHGMFIYFDMRTGGSLVQLLGIGFIIISVIFNFFWGTTFLILLKSLEFLFRISQYELLIFSLDPSSSELVAALSNFIRNGLYTLSTISFATTITLFSYSLLFPLPPLWLLTVLIWGPVFGVFGIGHFNLARIIGKAKQSALNALQEQIEHFRNKDPILEAESLNRIDKLLALHEKVKATNDTAINIKVILNFINSLLLPLPTFLLANWDQLTIFLTNILR